MIPLPFRRPDRDPTIRALYGMIVAQARAPQFYGVYGVPDTVPGRIEMIMLHLALLLRRLRSEETGTRSLQQNLFDLFCQDMDDNFREMGVGDLSVPKEMKRIAEAFYGRAKAYDTALDAKDRAALAVALARNVHGTPVAEAANRLAGYVTMAVEALERQPADAIRGGNLHYPAPDAVAPIREANEAR